jgi:putative hydrolase of the HAD superfamily
MNGVSESGERFLIWDFDGTLATRVGGWAGALQEVVTSGYPHIMIPVEHFRPHLQGGFPWHAPEVVRAPVPPDVWWENLNPLFARALSAATGLTDTDAGRLALTVRSTYLSTGPWQLFDDTLDTLEQLRARGWKNIILSNHAPELESLVAHLGLTHLFEAIYNSGVTGKEKPNPAAFECVFADFPEARAGWMIGDNWNADVGGASAVGMRSILVRNDHPGAPLRCAALGDVIDFLDRAS